MRDYNDNQVTQFCTVSRASAYLVTTLQMPVMVYLMCRNQRMSVDSYTFETHMANTNTTALDAANPVIVEMMYNTNVLPLFTLCSFLLTAFGAMTSYIDDMDTDLNNQVYEANNEHLKNNPFFILWHFMFASIVMLHHVLYPVIICAPFDLHTLIIIIVPMLASLHAMYTQKVCSPK